MTPLVPCPACRRHVRCSHASCPFCAADLPNDLDQTPVPLPQRERGAMPVFAPAVVAAIAAASIGCASSATKYGAPPPPPEDAGASHVQVPAAVYGAPPVMPTGNDSPAPVPKPSPSK